MEDNKLYCPHCNADLTEQSNIYRVNAEEEAFYFDPADKTISFWSVSTTNVGSWRCSSCQKCINDLLEDYETCY